MQFSGGITAVSYDLVLEGEEKFSFKTIKCFA